MTAFTRDHALQCRERFPGLMRKHDGHSTIFFDGPAGTQVPQCVADAMSDYLLHRNANHGGTFATSRETDAMLDAAGDAFAGFVGGGSREEVVFGQNMTSLTFHISRSIAANWQPGDEVILSAVDHDANITPWHQVASERGAVVRFIPFRHEDLTLDLDAYRKLLSERTRLVAVGCACNASGGINPVREITTLAHEVGAQVFLDAVHFAPHGLIDVGHWGCDFVGFSTYKFFGPHLGVLWGRRELLSSMTPIKVRPSSNDLPWRWMTGTQSHESIAGGLAAIDYLAGIGRKLSGNPGLARRDAWVETYRGISAYESEMVWALIHGLQAIEGVRVYGITDPKRAGERVATVCFTHADVPTPRLAEALAARGVCVWGGNYYALEMSTRLGLEPNGMIRVGLVHYNLMEEVERFLNVLREIIAKSRS
jgi:cysteine desulfurase family protein (TIGR01976 family)